MQAGAACRGGLGPAAAFMQSAHSGSLRKPEPAGGRISSGNAYYVFLLYDRKIHQLHCNSRNFCAGGDTKFGLLCDLITMWVIIVPVGIIAAFVLKLPVLAVYFLLNLDEFVKLPAVYCHYRKYKWARNLTRDMSRSDQG